MRNFWLDRIKKKEEEKQHQQQGKYPYSYPAILLKAMHKKAKGRKP